MKPQRLSDLVRPEAVVVPLEAVTREAAISALVDVLNFSETPQDREALKVAMLAREAAGSTGLGSGVAIPHARSSRISAPLLAIGLASKSIDFRSADGKPVTLIFLLAVPETDPSSHLKTLAALSRMASDKKLLRTLNKASSPQELYGLIAGIPV